MKNYLVCWMRAYVLKKQSTSLPLNKMKFLSYFVSFSIGSLLYFLMEAKAQYFSKGLSLTKEAFYGLFGKALVFGAIVTGALFLGNRWYDSKQPSSKNPETKKSQ